jgi:hypothetical protein
MRYMPSKGDIPSPDISIVKPKGMNEESWQTGRELGVRFWTAIASSNNISPSFKK